jgi:hypothetical protein
MKLSNASPFPQLLLASKREISPDEIGLCLSAQCSSPFLNWRRKDRPQFVRFPQYHEAWHCILLIQVCEVRNAKKRRAWQDRRKLRILSFQPKSTALRAPISLPSTSAARILLENEHYIPIGHHTQLCLSPIHFRLVFLHPIRQGRKKHGLKSFEVRPKASGGLSLLDPIH